MLQMSSSIEETFLYDMNEMFTASNSASTPFSPFLLNVYAEDTPEYQVERHPKVFL